MRMRIFFPPGFPKEKSFVKTSLLAVSPSFISRRSLRSLLTREKSRFSIGSANHRQFSSFLRGPEKGYL